MDPGRVGQVVALHRECEERQRESRGQRETQPGRQTTQLARAQDADADTELATGWPRQELEQSNQVGIRRLVEPATAQDVLVSKVAQVRDRAPEAADAETEGDRQHFPEGASALARAVLSGTRLWLSVLRGHVASTGHTSIAAVNVDVDVWRSRTDSSASSWLEQLDRVAGRILQEDLLAAGSRDDVVAECHSGAAQTVDLGFDVVDEQMNAVPPARARLDGRRAWVVQPSWSGHSGAGADCRA